MIKKKNIEANAYIINKIFCLVNNFSEEFLQNITDKLLEKNFSAGDIIFKVINIIKKIFNYFA